MSDQSTLLRRPFAVGAALLVAVAAFLVSASGPAGAGGPSYFNLDPASAPVGDTVTASSEQHYGCYDYDQDTGPGAPGEVEVTVVDANDADVLTTMADVDDDGSWTVDIDTSGLAEGTYTVKARCLRNEPFNFNYQSETLTLTAPEVEPTTTTTSTTSPTETSTTEAPDTTAAPSDDSDDTPATPPSADAVPGAPSYTG